MAIQHGINPFTGKIGNIVGRSLNGTFITSTPGGFTKEVWKKGGAKMKRPTECATEFGRCSLTTNAIYRPINQPEFKSNLDGKANCNMVGKFVNFLKYDRAHIKGERYPNETSMQQIVGYQLNSHALATIKEKIDITEPDKNTIKVTLSRGQEQFDWPEIAAAVQIFFFTIQMNFEKQEAIHHQLHRHELRKQEVTPNLEIHIPTPAGNCLLLIGLRFMEEVNGEYYLLSNKIQNPLYVAHYRTDPK